jgi:hypothetical protein
VYTYENSISVTMFSFGGKKHEKHGTQLKISQGKKGALFVTLPSEDSDSRSLTRTSEATGSRNNLINGENSSKRAREDSKGDTNPEKKLELDKNDSLRSAATSGNKNEVEIGNLTEEEMITQVESVTLEDVDDSYAGATKKPRLNLPNLVYIQKGRHHREPIQKLHYDAFIDYLLDHIMEMKVDQCAKVDIDWHGWGLGRGLVACLNPETASFVKEVASKFTINGLLFKGWLKTEFGTRIIYSGRLAGTCWQKRKPIDTIKWILNVNGLKNFEFYLISWLKTPQGVLLRFEASGELNVALATRKHILNAGIAKLKLEKKVINSTNFDSQAAFNPENADSINSKETAE